MGKVVHSTSKKRDFIEFISQMTDTKLNEYIKTHGKPPKKVRLYHLVNKERYTYNEAMVINT